MCTCLCVLARRFLSREKKLNLLEGETGMSSRPPWARISGLCNAGDTQQPTMGGSKSSRGVRVKVGVAGQSHSRKQQGFCASLPRHLEVTV